METKRELYHNFKSTATLTLNVQRSYIKSILDAELGFQSASSIQVFCVSFCQTTPQQIYSNLICQGNGNSQT